MSSISTHVLDTALGTPAAGIAVTLSCGGSVLGSGTTDADGRFRYPQMIAPDNYQLTFVVGEYFAAGGRDAFYGEVVIRFRITTESEHYHVPLLLSPFGYSTYRGS